MRLANASNGLAFPPYDGISLFQSCHGHHKRDGYFRADAMPWNAVVHLLYGGMLTIVDATAHRKAMTDAQKFGVPTWCMVFNRAARFEGVKVCAWETRDMRQVAYSATHKKTVQAIRKFIRILGPAMSPAIIGQNVVLECHDGFRGDDKPRAIRDMILTAIRSR